MVLLFDTVWCVCELFTMMCFFILLLFLSKGPFRARTQFFFQNNPIGSSQMIATLTQYLSSGFVQEVNNRRNLSVYS